MIASAAAVQAAEARTSGEIYCVVARASASYFFPAAFMVTLAIVRHQSCCRLCARSLVVRAEAVDARCRAASHHRLRPGRFSRFFPAMRIHLVPLRQRYRHAHDNAMKQFLGRNIHITAARTGVLLFVSLAERYAEVVADAGINSRGSPGNLGLGGRRADRACAKRSHSPTASSRRSARSVSCSPAFPGHGRKRQRARRPRRRDLRPDALLPERGRDKFVPVSSLCAIARLDGGDSWHTETPRLWLTNYDHRCSRHTQGRAERRGCDRRRAS